MRIKLCRSSILTAFLTGGLLFNPAASAQTPDATSHAAPKRAVVWSKGGKLMIGNAAGQGGEPINEVFGFDEDARKSGPAGGGIVTTIKDNPIPVALQLGGGFSGTMWGRYSNVLLDFHSLADADVKYFTLGDEKTTKGVETCSIHLLLGNAKELYVSPDYVIFPDQLRAVEKGGPFAQLLFSFGPDSIPPDSTLIVSRNGKEIARSKLQQAQVPAIELTSVENKDDVAEWKIEDRAGTLTHNGRVGFPVGSAVPNLVEYIISVDKHRIAKK